MKKLTAVQEKIYNFIKSEIRTKGVTPSIREICQYVGLSSTSSVHHHLHVLEDKGFIKRSKSKNRCIEILDENFYNINPAPQYNDIPIIGNVSAGQPILAVENIDGYFPVPTEYLSSEVNFMLRVKGNSMINAGIFNNDLVLVKQQPTAENGDIIIALIDDSVTCKRYYLEEEYVRLQPENENYSPIYVKELTILGKVMGLFRSYR